MNAPGPGAGTRSNQVGRSSTSLTGRRADDHHPRPLPGLPDGTGRGSLTLLFPTRDPGNRAQNSDYLAEKPAVDLSVEVDSETVPSLSDDFLQALADLKLDDQVRIE